jgi:hypothetical protein
MRPLLYAPRLDDDGDIFGFEHRPKYFAVQRYIPFAASDRASATCRAGHFRLAPTPDVSPRHGKGQEETHAPQQT